MNKIFLFTFLIVLICFNICFAANQMPTVSYYFTIIPDNESPYVVNLSPGINATNVAQNTTVAGDVLDDDSGVDMESIDMKINGIIVTTEKTAINKGYRVVYTPVSNFLKGSLVNVSLDAKDLAQ